MEDTTSTLEFLGFAWLILAGIDYVCSYYRFGCEARDRGHKNAVNTVSPWLAELMHQKCRTLPTKEFHFYMIIRSLAWPWYAVRWLAEKAWLWVMINTKRP